MKYALSNLAYGRNFKFPYRMHLDLGVCGEQEVLVLYKTSIDDGLKVELESISYHGMNILPDISYEKLDDIGAEIAGYLKNE